MSWGFRLVFALTLGACVEPSDDSGSIAAAPEVVITSPEEGARFHQGDSFELVGVVSDPAELRVTWMIDGDIDVATELTDDTVVGLVDTATLAVGGHIGRLQAIDGDLHTAYAHVSFTIDGPTGAPTVGITSPQDGLVVELGDGIAFVAEADDLDTPADALEFAWSSSLDGALTGAIDVGGQSVLTTNALSVGTHVIAVEVTDADGEVATDGIEVTVAEPPPVWACGAENQTLVYATDFDFGSLPDEFTGQGELTDVQGWDGFGNGDFLFAGDMVRNTTNPPRPLRLDLDGLPPHNTIRVAFLFAMIDSWDGLGVGYGNDTFEVSVDDDLVFSHVLAACCGTSDWDPPSGSVLSSGTQLGFNSLPDMSHDAAFDMSLEPAFDGIPHTGSSVAIEWSAAGSGWQGGDDESWAIDALCISVGE